MASLKFFDIPGSFHYYPGWAESSSGFATFFENYNDVEVVAFTHTDDAREPSKASCDGHLKGIL